MRRKKLCSATVRVMLFLGFVSIGISLPGCAPASVPLGERAVVRLAYLEKTSEGYEALTAVYDFDFAGGEESAEAPFVWLFGSAEEPLQALFQAASQQGDWPFFAQNDIILLGPHIANEELLQTIKLLSDDAALFRDPSLWLWRGGINGLAACKTPAKLIKAATVATQKGEDTIVLRVLDGGEAVFAGALPELTFTPEV